MWARGPPGAAGVTGIGGGGYVPLWCKSGYSFLEGASHPEELVEEAHRLGLRAVALTDRDGVYGMVRAHLKAQELGIQLLVGAEIHVDDGSPIVLLAEDRAGYANLGRLISRGRLRAPKGHSQVSWTEVAEHAPGLIALWGGAGSRLAEPAPPESIIAILREAFDDRLYALLARHQQAGDPRREMRLRARARRFGLPVVAGMEVLYHTPARRPLQDVLTCLRHGVTLATAGTRIKPNAEHALRAPRSFAWLYEDDVEAIRQTEVIAERCRFTLSELRYRYPVECLPDGTPAREGLYRHTWAGAQARYPGGLPEAVRAQIERELALIHELEYEGYFLTMHELVRFCHVQDILCQGRGSAANSAVCYCLGITAVDPVRMGLLFERFLSKERAEPPDIDLDIEHDRREEVIQHVYATYGRDHAAMVANIIRYRSRSAVRDVGKVLGVSEATLERLARHLPRYQAPTPDDLRTAGLDPEQRVYRQLLDRVAELEGLPRHLSIHPGGFLLGHEPVATLVPQENATLPGRTVIQWDKDDLEALGLFKVDLLGLGALNVIHQALELIARHRGRHLSLATLPAEDPATYRMIQKGDTVGVFQIESRAQMAMLPRLKPRNYYDLVIEVSLVRPGPITGGMVHPYLKRRIGEEPVTYPHPSLEPVLEKTLGIPLFQEQVMKLAMVAADYTPGEADQLRRDMAAWRLSGRIERHRDRLIQRMRRKGIARAFAEGVFEQIRGFGEYGFPESHAASFALIAYATAWLRCHYPAAYLCALLNAQPMGFYSPATLIEDGKRHGLHIRPVDIQASDWACTLESAPDSGEGMAVRMGLSYVKGLPRADADRLLAARAERAFASVADAAHRARLNRASVARLAGAGALAAFGRERRGALWEALGLDPPGAPRLPLATAGNPPDLASLTELETIHWDYAYTGHSPRGHPMGPLRPALRRQGLPDAATVQGWPQGRRLHYAGLVICRQRPPNAKGVLFLTLEDETGFINLVIWANVQESFQRLSTTQPFLGVTGKLQVQEGVVHVVAERLWTPEFPLDPVGVSSRDVH